MSTGVVAAGAAAFALYMYLKQQRAQQDAQLDTAPAVQETSRNPDVEHPPSNPWEFLYHVKEVVRFCLNETVGRWHTIDLFVGLAYLSNRDSTDYPAADIAAKGLPISLNPSSPEEAAKMLAELAEIRRYLLYCKGLKMKREVQQVKFWMEHLGSDTLTIIKQQHWAGLLRPAYVLVLDSKLKKLVLVIRGTAEARDYFTTLAGGAKPHHVVQPSGSVVLGYSHVGMLAAARWIFKQVTPLLRATLAEYPDYQLRIAGHSMGGGTAVLLTMMLRETSPDFASAHCYAIACPSCMTLELAMSCRDYVTSVMNGTDIVPTFCGATVDALREEVTKSSWFVEFQRDMRSSVYRALQGGMRTVGSATRWTTRNIFQPAAVPFRSCYAVRSKRRVSDSYAPASAQSVMHASQSDSLLTHRTSRSLDGSEPSSRPGDAFASSSQVELELEVESASPVPARSSLEIGLYSVGMAGSPPQPSSSASRHIPVRAPDFASPGLPHEDPQSGQPASDNPSPLTHAPSFRMQDAAEVSPNTAANASLSVTQATLRRRLWPWATSTQGEFSDISQPSPQGPLPVPPDTPGRNTAGSSSSMQWTRRMAESMTRVSVQTGAALGQGVERSKVAAQSAGSWMWGNIFKACTAPRRPPTSLDASGPSTSSPSASLDMPSQELAHPQDEDSDDDGAVEDPEAGALHSIVDDDAAREQLQAGINAVVAAVTSQASGEISQAEAQAAAEAVETLLGEGSPDRTLAQHAADSSSSEHMASPSQHSSALSALQNRKQYPAGRILHFFPSAVLQSHPHTSINADLATAAHAAASSSSNVSDEASAASTTPADATAAAVAAAQQPYVLFEVPRPEAYSRIRLCKTMVSDHLVPAYLQALDSVVSQLQASFRTAVRLPSDQLESNAQL